MTPVLRGLAKLKSVRGTPFDIFSYTRERRNERALVGEYEDIIEYILDTLTPDTHARFVDVARAPQGIKGFGSIKQAAIEEVRRDWRENLGKESQ